MSRSPSTSSTYLRAKRDWSNGSSVSSRVSRPEDTVLQKLRWSLAAGGGEQGFTDALRVYEVQQGALDLAYLDTWAGRIGVADLLGRVKREAEPL